MLLVLLAVTGADVVPWVLTGIAAVGGLVGARARLVAEQAKKASTPISAFEAVTQSQGSQILQLSHENGVLRQLLRQSEATARQNEAQCRADLATLEAEVETLEDEVRTLRRKVQTLEGNGS